MQDAFSSFVKVKLVHFVDIFNSGCVDVWEPKVLRAGASAHFQIPILNNVQWPAVKQHLNPNSLVCLADGDCQQVVTMEEQLKLHNDISLDEDTECEVEVNEKTGETLDMSYSEENVYRFKEVFIRNLAYTEIDYRGRDVVLVIGGETNGLSTASRKLAYDFDSFRVFIPMCEGINSLNAAMATSIISFEIKRQLTQCSEH